MARRKRSKEELRAIFAKRKDKRTKTFYHGSFESKKIDLNKIALDRHPSGSPNKITNAFHAGTLKAAKFRLKDKFASRGQNILNIPVDEINLNKIPHNLFRVKVKTNKLANKVNYPIDISDTLANTASTQKAAKSFGLRGILYRNKAEDIGSTSVVIWDKAAIKKIIRVKTKRQKKGKYSK